MIEGGIRGATVLALRCDSGESWRDLARADGDCCWPGGRRPRLEAMSRASEGDSSRVRALSLAAAMADVVEVFLGGVDSFEVVVIVAAASSAKCVASTADGGADSAIASFNWAVFCDLMRRASFSCWASSRSSTLRASLSPAVFAAREKSAAALRCSSAASSQCTLSVCSAALRAWACA
jgi:hypothetical protein